MSGSCPEPQHRGSTLLTALRMSNSLFVCQGPLRRQDARKWERELKHEHEYEGGLNAIIGGISRPSPGLMVGHTGVAMSGHCPFR